MNKKICVLFLISLYLVSFVFTSFVIAQDFSGIQQGLENNAEKLQNITNTAQQFTETSKWTYLAEEWKKILLKNKTISGIDGFLRQINFVFVFLFGENYDLSLTLVFAIFLWFLFFYEFNIVFRDYSAFDKSIAMIIAFAIAVISAQMGIYKILSDLLFKLIFYKEGIWKWIWFFILLFGFIFVLILSRSAGKAATERRKKREEKQAKLDRRLLHKEVETINKSFGGS